MRLSKENIQFIDNYLIKNDVKYWDVRLELLDHIVSAVEDKMEHENLSFEESLLQIHRGFGNQLIRFGIPEDQLFEKGLYQSNIGFQRFIRKKQVELGRKYTKNYFKTLIPFLTSSKFLLEYMSFILIVYVIFQYNPKTAFITALIGCSLIEFMNLSLGFFGKSNRKSLNVQSAVASSSLFFTSVYFIILGFNSLYKDELVKPYFFIIIIFMIIYPFLRHSYNCYKNIVDSNKKDYELYIS